MGLLESVIEGGDKNHKYLKCQSIAYLIQSVICHAAFEGAKDACHFEILSSFLFKFTECNLIWEEQTQAIPMQCFNTSLPALHTLTCTSEEIQVIVKVNF